MCVKHREGKKLRGSTRSRACAIGGKMGLQFTEERKTKHGAGSRRETDQFSSPMVPLRLVAFPGACPGGRGKAGVQEKFLIDRHLGLINTQILFKAVRRRMYSKEWVVKSLNIRAQGKRSDQHKTPRRSCPRGWRKTGKWCPGCQARKKFQGKEIDVCWKIKSDRSEATRNNNLYL